MADGIITENLGGAMAHDMSAIGLFGVGPLFCKNEVHLLD